MRHTSRPFRIGFAWIAVAFAGLLLSPPARGQLLPEFDPANFPDSTTIDNPYHPVVPNTLYKFRGVEFDADDPDADPVSLAIDVLVTTTTKEIGGVTARAVREKEFLDGLLVEDTTDYFAQDKFGNVWYMEEKTADLSYDDEGNLVDVDTGGSWRHGVNGAKATYIMPASVEIGDTFYNEFAPNDEVLDVSEILSTTLSRSVPAGEFTDVIQIKVIDVPEPEEFEIKYMAPGIGRFFIESDFNNAGVPLNTLPLDSVSAIPLPPMVLPSVASLVGIMLVAVFRQRRAARL